MDLTTYWAFWQRYGRYSGLAITGLVLFGTGWQLGRVMSPYYASHPIVFEKTSSTEGAVRSSGGTADELAQLRAVGVAQREPKPEQTQAAVAGVFTAEEGQAETAGRKLFVGSVNSDKYHHKDCGSAKQIKTENQLWFDTREEAEKAGYVPSACTKEKLGL